MLENSVPEGLYPVERTHAGAVIEELQPMGRPHVGEVQEALQPMLEKENSIRRKKWQTKCYELTTTTIPLFGEDIEESGVKLSLRKRRAGGRFLVFSCYISLSYLVINWQ